MSAGRRRLWWRHVRERSLLDIRKEEQLKKEKEEEDGRFKSERSERRVPSS